MDDQPTSVYIITCGDLVKIGVSKDPASRLKLLATGAPYRPRLIATRAFKSRRAAFYMETRLHRLFREYRENGEWFRITAEHAVRSLRNVQVAGDGHSVRDIVDATFGAGQPLV